MDSYLVFIEAMCVLASIAILTLFLHHMLIFSNSNISLYLRIFILPFSLPSANMEMLEDIVTKLMYTDKMLMYVPIINHKFYLTEMITKPLVQISYSTAL